ncbi:MAG: carbohydrate kinase family protein [bacterium]|nr:MAG: carbohydrate kinase family protein [bacterium]
MARQYDITVAGHICLDIIPSIPDTGIKEIGELFKPGKLINVNAASISTGGPVSNTGIALKKLGLNVAFMARVGKDELGGLIIQLLNEQGHTRGVSVSKQDRTSYTIAIAPPGIDRIFLHHPGANDHFSSNDLNEKIISQSKLFHFGYPPLMANCYHNEGEELAKIFRLAKSVGATTSLDMALPDPNSASGKAPWRQILVKVLPYVDIFLPSIEEVFFMLDPEQYFAVKTQAGTKDVVDFINPKDYTRLAEKCLQLGSKIVVIKAAHRGVYILTDDLNNKKNLGAAPPKDTANWSNRELWCPAFRIDNIASATGSGDSAIAGFLTAYVKGYSIEEALKYANCVGYQNLHELDAVSGIKDWEQTSTMLESGQLAMIELPLPGDHWQWNSEFQLWVGGNKK